MITKVEGKAQRQYAGYGLMGRNEEKKGWPPHFFFRTLPVGCLNSPQTDLGIKGGRGGNNGKRGGQGRGVSLKRRTVTGGEILRGALSISLSFELFCWSRGQLASLVIGEGVEKKKELRGGGLEVNIWATGPHGKTSPTRKESILPERHEREEIHPKGQRRRKGEPA